LLHFRAFEATGPVSFRAELSRTDGLAVFSTVAPAQELPGSGTARLEIPRLGLAPGEYAWDVSCYAGEACLDAQRGVVRFTVEGEARTGVIAPAHAWSALHADASEERPVVTRAG
jgi:hypothetical protein